MVFAAYADAGAGLAFLLLTTLSAAGLVVLLVRALIRPAKLRHPKFYLVAAGLIQGLVVWLWARSDFAPVPRHTLEWAWLGSLGLVVASLVAGAVWRTGPRAVTPPSAGAG